MFYSLLFLGGVLLIYSSLTYTGLPYSRHPEVSPWLRASGSIGGVAALLASVAHLLPRRRSTSKLAVNLLVVSQGGFLVWGVGQIASIILSSH